MIVALLLIVEREAHFWITLAAIAIVGREIIISALREWMADLGERTTVNVAFIGKVKTMFQMFAIGFLLYENDLWGMPVYTIGLTLLYIAAALTLWSMFVYLKAAWPMMKEKL